MFKKAQRQQIKLKLAITGPTGSGKTYSALRLAKGLGGKTAVIDTENGSASLYSDKFEFDVLDMKPPFTTEKYIEAINAAEKAGYENIIIDSLTHAWAGEGGLLEQKAELDKKPGSNQWTNWGPIDKRDQALKNAYLHSSCNIISTMRSKMEYAQNEKEGKKKIEKVGLAPIQRDGLSYEFTIVFDVWMDHSCEVSKDRTGIFADRIFKITEETGEEIKRWIASGAAPKSIYGTSGEVEPKGPSNNEPVKGNKRIAEEIQPEPRNEHKPKEENNRPLQLSNDRPITMQEYSNLYSKAQEFKRYSKSVVDEKLREMGIENPMETKLHQYVSIMKKIDPNWKDEE